jgi:hypothetical protein
MVCVLFHISGDFDPMEVDVEVEEERRKRKRGEARERVIVQQRKLREVMRGKTLVRNKVTGEIRVLDKPEENMEEEEELNYDELVGDDENHIDLMIEVEESMQNDKVWNTLGSTGSLDGHSYLNDLAEVEREDDRKRESVKKRKKVEEEEVEIKIRGLKVSPGWVERTKEALEDEKWQRIVIDKTGRGDGSGKERREGMTIPAVIRRHCLLGRMEEKEKEGIGQQVSLERDVLRVGMRWEY